jgi:3-methyladenine DNA glycosylase AlkD
VSGVDFLKQAQTVLAPLADSARAGPMAAYMKDHFVFFGIAAPARRAACAPLLRSASGLDSGALLGVAQQLWRMEQREYQYLAVDLLARYHKKLGLADVPALMALVQSKPWWDGVDGLAGVIGDVLKAAKMKGEAAQECMDTALMSTDFWVQRIALLHQLGWREQLDTRRLACYCLYLAAEKEFFIRKATGWALRDYARHDPDWVRQFLLEHKEKLSGLSYREAAKHL